MTEAVTIPNKSIFRVNEVCSVVGIKPYVLRYWESEFEQIVPIYGSNGQKLYEQRDIEALLLIKKLLFEDKLKIDEAKFRFDDYIRKLEGPLVQEGPLIAGPEEVDAFTEMPPVVPEVAGKANDQADPVLLQSKKLLNDREIQKLILAKARLKSMMSLTNSLKERNNW